MKTVSKEMFQTVRKALKKFISLNGNQYSRYKEIPDKLCSRFLEIASETLSDYGYEHGASIVVRNGHPHLMIDDEVGIWEASNTLCIGGVEGIRNEELKKATMAFLAAYIKNNPFTSYNDTVWSCLFDSVHSDYPDGYTADNDEENDMLQSYQEDMLDNISNEEALNALFKEIKDTPTLPREELVSLLDSVSTESAYEKELLDTLKAGVPYAYEKRWDDSDFDGDGYGYASVCVSPWDYFCVNLASNDPFVIGMELTNSIYDGDVYMVTPKVQKLLLDDGTLEDIYDREGFSLFCQELTNKLNNF